MTCIEPTALVKFFTWPHCGAICMQNLWYKNWDGEVYSDIYAGGCLDDCGNPRTKAVIVKFAH